jgi:hypothetical protein
MSQYSMHFSGNGIWTGCELRRMLGSLRARTRGSGARRRDHVPIVRIACHEDENQSTDPKAIGEREKIDEMREVESNLGEGKD